MLKHIECRACQLSEESVATDLQTSCDLQIRSRTVAETFMEWVSKWMQWCKPHSHWTLEQWKSVLWRDKSNGLEI